MTITLTSKKIAPVISEKFPSSILETNLGYLLVKPESLTDIISFLKTSPEFDFDLLNSITGVDYFDYFEIVYHLTSINHNRSLVLKTRCYGRDNPVIPSIVNLYRGADFQEREIFDLLGVRFEGHPNMKRIFLWDGFEGHPLRKDYL